MHFRRMLAVVMAGAAATAGITISAGLSAASAQAATTSVQLPIAKYSHMLLDPAHQHIFFTSGTGYSSILVTDYSGNTVATIGNEPGATGLAISSDGSTVYAALVDGDAVSAISTSTLAETARYATGTGTHPTSVAYTSGKIWFGYGSYGDPQHGVGSIDPATSPATVDLGAAGAPYGGGYDAPMVVASPNGELVTSGPYLQTYDVSSGTATALAPGNSQPGGYASLQITPDGKDVVTSSGQAYRVSDLSADVDYGGGYWTGGTYGSSVSVADDGTVALGATGCCSNSAVEFFAPSGRVLTSYYPSSNGLELAADGVALTPDASELFAVTDLNGSALPTLNIVSDPSQVDSGITIDGPGTPVPRGGSVTLTGGLSGSAGGFLYALPYDGGQTLTVTRFDPGRPDGVPLPDITTAADGSYSFTDTPPKIPGLDRGTVTYQVSYAGGPHLAASTASSAVTVQYTGS